MKLKSVSTILVVLFFIFTMSIYANEQDIKPNLISPGDGGNLSIVEESTPTFSWTSVPWASEYRIVVFKSGSGSLLSYEEISASETPIINKEIKGRATSWTPSSIQRMSTGSNYTWYVQAIDINGTGTWSRGGSFRVEIPVVLTGIEEKLREKLKEKGMSDESLDEVFDDLKSEVKEVVVREQGKSTSGDNLSGVLGTEGASNTFYGVQTGVITTGLANSFFGSYAGYVNTEGQENTFLGRAAGYSNSTGNHNTFSGYYAGYSNTTGNNNTFSGHSAGYSNSIGSGNVFLGNTAGYSETGYNKLYIESDYGSRTTPLIYGEFDNDIVTINGKLGIGTTTPAWPLEVVTTGSNAKIVINRTDGATGHFLVKTDFATFGTASNHPLRMNVNNIPRVFLLPNGNFGLGVTNPLYPLHLASGAHCTSSGVWQNASSRDFKENIMSINSEDAFETLKGLEPVTYNYKLEKDELYAGFIAEDVPEMVASKGRKSLGTMDIVAVLTKVVKEQQNEIKEQKKVNKNQQKLNAELLKRLEKLEKK